MGLVEVVGAQIVEARLHLLREGLHVELAGQPYLHAARVGILGVGQQGVHQLVALSGLQADGRRHEPVVSGLHGAARSELRHAGVAYVGTRDARLPGDAVAVGVDDGKHIVFLVQLRIYIIRYAQGGATHLGARHRLATRHAVGGGGHAVAVAVGDGGGQLVGNGGGGYVASHDLAVRIARHGIGDVVAGIASKLAHGGSPADGGLCAGGLEGDAAVGHDGCVATHEVGDGGHGAAARTVGGYYVYAVVSLGEGQCLAHLRAGCARTTNDGGAVYLHLVVELTRQGGAGIGGGRQGEGHSASGGAGGEVGGQLAYGGRSARHGAVLGHVHVGHQRVVGQRGHQLGLSRLGVDGVDGRTALQVGARPVERVVVGVEAGRLEVEAGAVV